jgi:DNA polymerase-3 subunit epsilon
MAASEGVKNRKIHEMPIAIVDFETTGLTPGFDRVVEISIFKLEPEKNPYLALDTLVNPRRPVAATEIHGITDKDIVNAPTFDVLAGDFVDALSGCIVASYNVYFDIKFMDYELRQIGVSQLPPHLCLMYMRPLLNLGQRCNLETACQEHGIDYRTAHIAAVDAEASSKLMKYYLNVLSDKKISTYGQLSHLKSYKYLNSFANNPLPEPSCFNLRKSEKFLSRAGFRPPVTIDPEKQAITEYWDALRIVLADLEITEEEINYIIEIRKKLQLPKEKLRALHAKVFAAATCQFIADKSVDDKEVLKLKRLFQCLSKLGWAPGE